MSQWPRSNVYGEKYLGEATLEATGARREGRRVSEEANWKRDSDMVFTAVSTSGALDYKDAELMVVTFYVPDMSVSRAGISHALKRLEKFWKEKSERGKDGGAG